MKKLKEIKQKLGSTIEKAEIMRVSKPNVRRKKSANDFLSRGGSHDAGDNSSSGITEALDTYGDTQIEKINYQLDKVLNARFLFPELIITAIGAILERYSSVNLPALDASEVVDNHVIFHVDTYLGTPCFLFITINKDHHGHYEGFAQVVDEEQLMELMMIDHEVEDEEIPSYPSHFILQARHAADD